MMLGAIYSGPDKSWSIPEVSAPKLNPVEQIWGYAKHNPLANCTALDLDALTANTRCAARAIQHRQPLLRSFLKHSPLFLRLK